MSVEPSLPSEGPRLSVVGEKPAATGGSPPPFDSISQVTLSALRALRRGLLLLVIADRPQKDRGSRVNGPRAVMAAPKEKEATCVRAACRPASVQPRLDSAHSFPLRERAVIASSRCLLFAVRSDAHV